MGKKSNKKTESTEKRIRRHVDAVVALIMKYHNGVITPKQAELLYSDPEYVAYIINAIRQNRIRVEESNEYAYSDEELKELARLYKKDGNVLALYRIFGLLRPYILWKFKKLPIRWMDEEEYMGLACATVLEYVNNYDPEEDERYGFTWMLGNRLMDAAREEVENNNLLHLPAKLVAKVDQCLDAHEAAQETVDERTVAKEVGCSVETARIAIEDRNNRLFISIDINVSDQNNNDKLQSSNYLSEGELDSGITNTIREIISRPGQTMSEIERVELKASIDAALDKLPPMEGNLIRLMYGIGNEIGETMSLNDARKELGISREYARQTYKRALAKLKELLADYDE